MRRALGSLVAAAALAALAALAAGALGCGSKHGVASPRLPGASASNDACGAAAAPIVAEPPPSVPSVEPPWGARIARIEVMGATHVSRELALETIELREGGALDGAAVARDVRALFALEAFETVSVDAERTGEQVVVKYLLRERRVVGEVTYRWPEPLLAGHFVPLARGELYDPARVVRTRIDLETNLVEAGHLRAKVDERQRAAGADRVDVCFIVDAGPRFVIDRIAFVGNDHVPQGDLAALIQSHGDRANQPAKPYRDDLLENDLLHVSALYYDRGFLDVHVGPARTRTTLEPNGKIGHITVEIPIREGRVYRIRGLRFSGSGAKTGATAYSKLLDVRSGEIFSRAKLVAGFAKIRELHHARGEAIEVTPETNLDPSRGEVDLIIEVKPTTPSKPPATGKSTRPVKPSKPAGTR